MDLSNNPLQGLYRDCLDTLDVPLQLINLLNLEKLELNGVRFENQNVPESLNGIKSYINHSKDIQEPFRRYSNQGNSLISLE